MCKSRRRRYPKGKQTSRDQRAANSRSRQRGNIPEPASKEIAETCQAKEGQPQHLPREVLVPVCYREIDRVLVGFQSDVLQTTPQMPCHIPSVGTAELS